MKGGVALALVGLLAVILGVRGTAGNLWRAAIGQSAGASSSTTAGSSPAASPTALATPAAVVPPLSAAPGQPGNPSVQI